MESFFSLSPRVTEAAERAEHKLGPVFSRIGEIALYNTQRVMAAFQEHRVSESHFLGSTGYGYDDRGREVLDAVWAQVFGAEDALVRHFMISGTHALTIALFAACRPGGRLLSVTGKPYDTLHEVIGIRGEGSGSLREYGVTYDELDLLPDGTLDWEGIKKALQTPTQAVFVQRSKGYSVRRSVPVEDIGRLAELVHSISPGTVVMVDNCYGEFVEKMEPTAVGADLCAGSLIKNPGGGMAETGGYIAGRKDLVKRAAYRLTSPGIGKKAGATLNQSRAMFRGFFMAPHVVAQALKTAVFAAALYEELGFECSPRWDEPRTDIIQTVLLGTPEGLKAFCRGIQQGAPVDSFVAPEPWDMPGYDDPIIMAAGAFVQGSSIELSADGPMRPPYPAYFQGGLTFESGRTGILLSAQRLFEEGLLK